MNREIVLELYRALILLNAPGELLATVGSWGSTMPDEDTLAHLKGWNEAALDGLKNRIIHYALGRPDMQPDTPAKPKRDEKPPRADTFAARLEELLMPLLEIKRRQLDEECARLVAEAREAAELKTDDCEL